MRSLLFFTLFIFAPFAFAQPTTLPSIPQEQPKKDKPGKDSGVDKTAMAVIQKAIVAHGGADTLKKHAATRFTLKGTLGAGKNETAFSAMVHTNTPGQYRMEMDTLIGGVKYSATQVVNYPNFKSSRTYGGLPLANLSDAERDELIFASILQEINQLLPLQDTKKFTVKVVPDEDVGGKPCAGVMVVVTQPKKEVKLLFDRESGMLARTTRKGLGPGDNGPVEVSQENTFSEYKVFEGVKVATKVAVTHDGKPFMTITVSDYARVEKPDLKLFSTDE